MTIRIAYPDSMAYQIMVNGKTIEMNNWDNKLKNYGEIKKSFCGENRYLSV